MPTTTDYVSSVSLLPTTDFLNDIAHRQWATESDYFIGFSPVQLNFFSSANSEVICLNSESELLSSEYGAIKLSNPFAHSRPELSPILSVYQKGKYLALSQKPTSFFLYRLEEDKTKSVILASNVKDNPEDTTEAPPLDCFSRECMTWFSSDTDYFIGFSSYSDNLSGIGSIADGSSIAATTPSSDILSNLIDYSTASISHTSIQVVNTASMIEPFVRIQFCTGVQYSVTSTSPDPNILLLYGVNSQNDSLVSFVHDFGSKTSGDILLGAVTVEISWNPENIVII